MKKISQWIQNRRDERFRRRMERVLSKRRLSSDYIDYKFKPLDASHFIPLGNIKEDSVLAGVTDNDSETKADV